MKKTALISLFTFFITFMSTSAELFADAGEYWDLVANSDAEAGLRYWRCPRNYVSSTKNDNSGQFGERCFELKSTDKRDVNLRSVQCYGIDNDVLKFKFESKIVGSLNKTDTYVLIRFYDRQNLELGKVKFPLNSKKEWTHFEKDIKIKNDTASIDFLFIIPKTEEDFTLRVDNVKLLRPRRFEDKVERFYELPLSDIEPKGWLRDYLEIQRDGLLGHLEVAGFPFNTEMWACEVMQSEKRKGSWASYEQTAYWIDSMIKAGYLLEDELLINKAKKQVEYVLSHPAENGYLGPKHITDTRWPHAVFARALMAYYSATHDKRIIEALKKHFIGDIGQITKKGNAVFQGNTFNRNVCNVEALCWLYEKTGDKNLLDIAEKLYQLNGDINWMMSDEKSHMHGVSYSEKIKLPAILYMSNKEKFFLNASGKGFYNVQVDHVLADGTPSSTEGLCGKRSRRCHESCVISDYSWSLGYMLMATENPEWADKIERTVFNAGFGAVGKEYKTHQYYSSPNQMIATHYSNHEQHHPNRMAYRPGHPVKCCTGNIHRFLPNYVSRMWMSDANGGLAATLYGPVKIEAKVGKNNKKVVITEKTEYPFKGEIDFVIEAEEKVKFPLLLRIPKWCENAKVLLNGKELNIKTNSGCFAVIERTFKDNDVISLDLSMDVRISRWPENGVTLERGPLVYSLYIKPENKKVEFIGADNDESDPNYPAWDITPGSEWRYGLKLRESELDEKVTVKISDVVKNPWIAENTPIKLEVPVHKMKIWDFQHVHYSGKHGDLDKTCTPHLPNPAVYLYDEKEEKVTFVPLGSTYLRLTVLPDLNQYRTERNKK